MVAFAWMSGSVDRAKVVAVISDIRSGSGRRRPRLMVMVCLVS